ncbi:MAG: hypothetical protein IKL20_08065 [Alistipes sp.]|nr:hypothetical protein [Alistipes sp.]
MKRLLLTIATVAIALSLLAQTPKHTEWKFSTKRTEKYLENGVYKASTGKGSINFVGKKATATVGVKRGYPAAENTRKGDYWLMTIPVENLKAGTAIDLWLPFLAEPSDEPHTFTFEYLDDGKWRPVTPANKSGANCTSTTSKSWPRMLWHTIRLNNGVRSGNVLLRLRLCDKRVEKCSLYGGTSGQAPKIAILDEQIPSDTTRILFIGNSYTYYNLYPMQLKELAWYEGHYLDCALYFHGGYSMKRHLADHVSRETVELGGFDYAFLQGQSISSLRIGTSADQNVVGEMGKMVDRVKKFSPKAKCIIEMTWGRRDGDNATKSKALQDIKTAHPEYFESYEAMQKVITANTTAIAQKLGVGLSPVGVAWKIVRRERPDIELYVRDGSHPSDAGSYLAAAVGYLTLFKEPFKADTPVRLDPEVARYLRSVAERVVLKAEN